MTQKYSRQIEILLKEKTIHDPKQTAKWAEEWNDIRDNATSDRTTAKHVLTDKAGGFCPYLKFIRLDALDKEDYPNHIADNSIYLEFSVDLFTHKVEMHRDGHVWLSEKDLQREPYKYLAMRSMTDIAKEKGVKTFRKQGFKNTDDLIKKITAYYKQVMQAVTEYTGGYPYKKGIEKADAA